MKLTHQLKKLRYLLAEAFDTRDYVKAIRTRWPGVKVVSSRNYDTACDDTMMANYVSPRFFWTLHTAHGPIIARVLYSPVHRQLYAYCHWLELCIIIQPASCLQAAVEFIGPRPDMWDLSILLEKAGYKRIQEEKK